MIQMSSFSSLSVSEDNHSTFRSVDFYLLVLHSLATSDSQETICGTKLPVQHGDSSRDLDNADGFVHPSTASSLQIFSISWLG